MQMADDQNVFLRQLIYRLAEHLAVEILAEAKAEDYEDAYVTQAEDLEEAAAALLSLGLEVPFVVKEVIRLSNENRVP